MAPPLVCLLAPACLLKSLRNRAGINDAVMFEALPVLPTAGVFGADLVGGLEVDCFTDCFSDWPRSCIGGAAAAADDAPVEPVLSGAAVGAL